MTNAHPARCFLCSVRGEIVPAGFHQIYPQNGSEPTLLDWWECRCCRGWFVHPVPPVAVIERYWKTVAYNDPKFETDIAHAKDHLQKWILAELPRWTKPGPLLDFGCNFGHFLMMAHQAGWLPTGFEPNPSAAEQARQRGFDVRCGWSLQEAGLQETYFSAITANDVFCLVWHPYETLTQIHRLLKPGGVLAMRLTNKRFILGAVRTFSRPGPLQDRRISRILQGQFHSVSLNSLVRIMRDVGLDLIQVQPHATTAPWTDLRWHTRIAYLGADLVYFCSLKKINLSPGVVLFARKLITS